MKHKGIGVVLLNAPYLWFDPELNVAMAEIGMKRSNEILSGSGQKCIMATTDRTYFLTDFDGDVETFLQKWGLTPTYDLEEFKKAIEDDIAQLENEEGE